MTNQSLIKELRQINDFKEKLFILCLPRFGYRLCVKKSLNTDLTRDQDEYSNFHEKYNFLKSFGFPYPTSREIIEVFEAILLSIDDFEHWDYIPLKIPVYAQTLAPKIAKNDNVYFEYSNCSIIEIHEKQGFANSPSYWN